MVSIPLIAAIAAGVMMTGFAANEMSHGGFAESMGMGHHHMMDYGGYHCTGPEDTENWQDHVNHMHGKGAGEHCRGGHMQMSGHQGMSGMGTMSDVGGGMG